MKSLTALLLVLLAVFVAEKPANATMNCSFFSRGAYICIEQTTGPLYAYYWSAIEASVEVVSGYPNRATAVCDNIDVEYTTHFGRKVQDIVQGFVTVQFWASDPQFSVTNTDDILCEGDSPVLLAFVRGDVLFWHDYSHWWDYWCSESAWNAGSCYHPNVYNSFYSWYTIYY